MRCRIEARVLAGLLRRGFLQFATVELEISWRNRDNILGGPDRKRTRRFQQRILETNHLVCTSALPEVPFSTVSYKAYG